MMLHFKYIYGIKRKLPETSLRVTLSLFAFILLAGCARSNFPSSRELIALSETEIRKLILTNTPIGTSRPDVERAFRQTFKRKWTVVDYEVRDLTTRRGFKVPVAQGDFYFHSDLAAIPRGIVTADVVTVYLLFSSDGQLKDVVAKKWIDGP